MTDNEKLDALVAMFPHLLKYANNCRPNVYPRYKGAQSWTVLFTRVSRLGKVTKAQRDWLREKAQSESARSGVPQ